MPKGPSLNPRDRRLAIQTEDHPVKYLSFEGTIPKGNYGAGKMQIWDSGTFGIARGTEPETALAQWQNGSLHLELSGGKLRGSFSLVRLKKEGEPGQWLFIKKKDRYAVLPAYDAEAVPASSANQDLIRFIPPILATIAPKIFDAPDWLFERKRDGYRIIATIANGTVRLYSRNGLRYDHHYPNVVAALNKIAHDVIFDGEIVVEDTEGWENFAALQNYGAGSPGRLRYYIFDMLHLNGYNMIALPLIERKSLIPGTLSELADGGELVRYCGHVAGEGKKFYNRALAEAREGVIAKKTDSVYRPGSRSDQWLKIKVAASEEAIICGYTDSVKGGALFGSRILMHRVEIFPEYCVHLSRRNARN